MTKEYQSRAEFVGTIVEQINQESSYEIIGREHELLCKIVLQVQWSRGKTDCIVLFANKEELKRHRIGKGLKVSVEGEIHTCNIYDNLPEKRRQVEVYIRVRKIRRVHAETPDKNRVILDGTLSQTPNYWKFPTGSRRANFNLCVKDSKEGGRSFVPCVANNEIADVICELEPWEELSFEGRFRSKNYTKLLETGEKQQRIAFEVMVDRLI